MRSIFADYLSGMGIEAIMKKLNVQGKPSRNGHTWCRSSVRKVLGNYSYTGNLLLQTTFRENHITKKTLPNRGELPMYHAENTHEAIVSMEDYQAVQTEMAQRSAKHNRTKCGPAKYPFTSMVVCGTCGKGYRRKMTRTGPVWICSIYNVYGKAACPSKQIPERTLEKATEEVLGLDAFDAKALHDKITAISAEGNNTLVFLFKDGTQTVKWWADRSRAESWTPEMKAATGEFAKKGQAMRSGYARVSTDSDEQFTSYEAQIDYYTRYIQNNPEWEFVAVYTDKGISATNTRHRDGFNQMISDALTGKIDLIVTKSVSRFARNTVDSLSTIRKLKENHIEVYFEKENIWTFDSKGELLLTIMSSLAQEESRSISENVT